MTHGVALVVGCVWVVLVGLTLAFNHGPEDTTVSPGPDQFELRGLLLLMQAKFIIVELSAHKTKLAPSETSVKEYDDAVDDWRATGIRFAEGVLAASWMPAEAKQQAEELLYSLRNGDAEPRPIHSVGFYR